MKHLPRFAPLLLLAAALSAAPGWQPPEEGERLFQMSWTEPQPQPRSGDGLGPLYNATSCNFCHNVDGRGHPPEEGGAEVPLLFRLSVPGEGGAVLPEPRYGWQLQEYGARGVAGEGRVAVRWEEVAGRYPDGERYSLRKPVFRFENLAAGPLDPRVQISARRPPNLLGVGLLESVPATAILALADEGDADRDGISGRSNLAADLRTGIPALGRFGWKASQPTVEQQSATALHEDMGITSDLLPTHSCMPGQKLCLSASHGGRPEITAGELERLTRYVRQLSFPARPPAQEPAVLRGEKLFRSAGCASCHHPRFETPSQTIHPYTDLLLHEMGPELADGRPDLAADGREWRTAPLWGLGLGTRNRLLHDGRARSPEEAILWHGGEAGPARERFKALSKGERAALLRFVESL